MNNQEERLLNLKEYIHIKDSNITLNNDSTLLYPKINLDKKKVSDTSSTINVHCACCSNFMYKEDIENNAFGENRNHGICNKCITDYFDPIYKKL